MKMKIILKKTPEKINNTDDEVLFQQVIGKVKPIKVDTIHFAKKSQQV